MIKRIIAIFLAAMFSILPLTGVCEEGGKMRVLLDPDGNILFDDYEDETHTYLDVTLWDTEICQYTIVRSFIDDEGNYKIDIYLANRTDKTLIFAADKFCMNRYMIPSAYLYETVGPRSESVRQVIFEKEKLAEIGLDSIDEIIAYYSVSYDCAEEDVYNVTTTIYPKGTVLDKWEIDIPDRRVLSDEFPVIEDETCSFLILSTTKTSGSKYIINCFYENITDKQIRFVIRSLFDDNVRWTEDILPGMRCYTKLYFPTPDIDSIAFSYSVYDDPAGEPYNEGCITYAP